MRLPSRVMRPKEPDRDRAVLVLHGAGGFEAAAQAYANFAIAFANNGLDAYLVPYFWPGSNAHC
jgi:dienelactone hydrolase